MAYLLHTKFEPGKAYIFSYIISQLESKVIVFKLSLRLLLCINERKN